MGNKYYNENRNHCIQNSIKWQKEHPEKTKEIRKKYAKRHNEEITKKQKEYRIKNKEKINKQRKEYYKNNKENFLNTTYRYFKTEKGKETLHRYYIKYYEKNKDMMQEKHKKWLRTKKGKELLKRMESKRRKMGFNILYENIFEEEIHWHHIDNKNVIAIPTDLHLLYDTYPVNIHREQLKPIIYQLYGFCW